MIAASKQENKKQNPKSSQNEKAGEEAKKW
jgi:hypothetical protein